MVDTRHKNGNWTIYLEPGGRVDWGGAQLAVLMDIRDELQQLNRVFACHNAQDIPNILRRIDKNTNAQDIPNILRRIDKNTKKRPRKKAKR